MANGNNPYSSWLPNLDSMSRNVANPYNSWLPRNQQQMPSNPIVQNIRTGSMQMPSLDYVQADPIPYNTNIFNTMEPNAPMVQSTQPYVESLPSAMSTNTQQFNTTQDAYEATLADSNNLGRINQNLIDNPPASAVSSISDNELTAMADNLQSNTETFEAMPRYQNSLGFNLDQGASNPLETGISMGDSLPEFGTLTEGSAFGSGSNDALAIGMEFGDLGVEEAINAPAQLGIGDKLKIAGGKINQGLDKLGGAGNVLGAGLMVGGNLAAMGQYGDAIGDVEEGLAEIPGMLSETMTSAQRETENIRDVLTSQVESTADASNTKLQQSLNQLASNPQQAVGNVKSKSNEIRRNLAEGIDMALANASDRFDMQSERIQEGKRESIGAIESMKAELKAKKKELEKEKEQAKWGAIVGAGSLVADAFLPGSGQLIRSGYSQYASRT